MEGSYLNMAEIISRIPNYEQQDAARKKEMDFAFTVCARSTDDSKWSQAIADRSSRCQTDVLEQFIPHTCQYCQKLVVDVSTPANEWAIHQGFANPKRIYFDCSRTDVEEGASNQCPLMTQFYDEVQFPTHEELRNGHYLLVASATMRGDVNGWDITGLSRLHLSNLQRPWEDWRKDSYKNNTLRSIQDIYFDVYAEPDNPAKNFVRNRPVRVNPAEDIVMDCNRHNLRHRIDAKLALGHDPSDLAALPTRLVHVAKVNEGWHLHLENFDDPLIQYCTLSYCWRFAPLGVTTRQNLAPHYDSIDFDELPRTIQDAVIVTERLGVTYLWIDALYIIQEDDDDKAREIAKMSSIYHNSVLTISASRALTVDEGFLHPRPQFIPGSQTYKLPYRLPGDQGLGSVVLGQSVPELLQNRLCTRAWAFQERVMSPRILDFDGQTTSISWWKHDGRVYVRDGGSVDHTRSWFDADQIRRADFTSTPDRDASDIDSMGDWIFRICDYTERNLSLPTDRILAIASVAERMAKSITNAAYLAGLWAEHLPWMLMWSMSDRKTRPPKPTNYQGPSWSWTGVNGQIHSYYPTHLSEENAEIKCDIVGYNTDLEYAHAPYGSLKAATLVITAKSRRVRWLRIDKDTHGGDRDDMIWHPDDQPAWTLPQIPTDSRTQSIDKNTNAKQALHVSTMSGTSSRKPIYTARDLLPAIITPDALEPEFAILIEKGGVTCLDITLVRLFNYDDGPYGLAVRDLGDGMYQRIGIFTTRQGHNYRETHRTERYYVVRNDTTSVTATSKEEVEEEKGEIIPQGRNDAEVKTSMSDILDSIGAGLENHIREEEVKQEQKKRERKDVENFVAWFDADDCEDRVLVLV